MLHREGQLKEAATMASIVFPIGLSGHMVMCRPMRFLQKSAQDLWEYPLLSQTTVASELYM